MIQRHRHRGYVLIVTLGLLVLAATMLVSLGRATMRRASEARESVEALQQRWGVVSCRKVILPNAEAILAREEKEFKKAVPVYRAGVRLGGQAFDLVVSDEQAKANVNVLLERADPSAVESQLVRTISGAAFKLRPLVEVQRPVQQKAATTGPGTQPTTEPVARRIESFAQVMDASNPRLLLEKRSAEASPMELVTCWGNGAINVGRASAKALKLSAGDALSGAEVDAIIRGRDNVYRQRGNGNIGDAVKKLVKPAGDGAKKQFVWTAESACHSLWVVTRTKQREFYYLVVRTSGDAAQVSDEAFVW
jgi:hypothetical protein